MNNNVKQLQSSFPLSATKTKMSEDETFSTTYEPFSGTAEETNTSSKPNRAGAGAGREPPSFLQVSGILLGFIFFAYFVLRFVNRRRFPNIKLKGFLSKKFQESF
jgi:hypothetical protein